MNEKKFKGLLITGNDSDSGTIAVLSKIAFGHNLDIVYSGNGEAADLTVQHELLEEKGFEKYTNVFITKLSFDDKDAMSSIIGHINSTTECNIVYVNHQEMNLDLKDNSWARVETHIDDKDVMSADIFYKMLIEEHGFKPNDWTDNIVNVSRAYNLYEWRKTGDLTPKYYNELCFSKLPKDFLQNMLEKYYMKKGLLHMQELEDCYKKDSDYNNYLELKKSEAMILRINIDDIHYRIAFVESDTHVSELGYDLAVQLPNVDIAAVLTSSHDKIRFRRGDNENIDVSVVARAFGGNGNPAAAGARITPKIQKILKEVLLNTLLKQYNINSI